MNLLDWILIAYCLGTTIILFLNHRRPSRGSRLLGRLEEIPIDELPPLQRIEALSKAAEVQSKQIPWYERSLSTIGVVGFFSMLVATGIQTTNANISEAKIQKLQQQLATLQEQQAVLEPAVARAARASVEQYWHRHVREEGTDEVLRLRLDTLEKSSSGDAESIAEMLDISLVLGDFHKALTLLEEHPDFVKDAKPYQLVSIAECYFVSGSTAHVSETLIRLQRDVATFNSSLRFRMLVLRALLAPDIEPYFREAAVVLRVGLPEAKTRLRRDCERLREYAAEFSRN